MNISTKEKLLNHLNKWQKVRSDSDKELLKSADEILRTISKIQKGLKTDCIADIDSPCDCPKCESYALEMKKEYEAGKLEPDEEEECEHWENDDGYCLDCGKDMIQTLVGQAEAMSEGDR